MKVFALLIFIVSCANVRYLTNTNISNYKLFKTNRDIYDFYDKKVKVFTKDQARKCQFVNTGSAKDNPVDQGKKYAELYLKAIAHDKYKANAVVIDRFEKSGPLTKVYGEIYNCSK